MPDPHPKRATGAPPLRNLPPKIPAVQVQAHRGGAALAPENTMVAFENAATLGAQWIEFDVQTCATGEVVVIHDEDLRRVAGQPDRVADLSLTDLQQADVGSHFSAEHGGARVPTLVELLETLRGRIRFNIEIKEAALRGDGTTERVAEIVGSMDLGGDVIVSSFNPGSLWRMRRALRVPLGLVYPMKGSGSLSHRVRDRIMRKPRLAPVLSVYALHPDQAVVTRDLVRTSHMRGLAINTWTVNDEVRMRELAAMRVNSLITDRPDLALKVTAEVDQRTGRA